MHFRPSNPLPNDESLNNLLAVSQVIDSLTQPGCFAANPSLWLVAARAETISWEIFRGRLVPPSQTRQTQSFLAWSLFPADTSASTQPAEPMLSVKLDVPGRVVHVVRALLIYGFAAVDGDGGAIESRETIQWSRELVGSIALVDLTDLGELTDELTCLIWQAVVGTSRLPLTSVEAPLPEFVLGQTHYLARTDVEMNEESIADWHCLLECAAKAPTAWIEKVKVVEFLLRRLNREELPEFCDRFIEFCPPAHWPLARLLRSLFNHVSLSPYTRLVENVIAWLELMQDRGMMSTVEAIDFLAWLLRQLCRHLTAYDLITFHHRGANYPDALALDAVLRAFLFAIEREPHYFQSSDTAARWRRRAVRQACLQRRQYEGHLVPDAPTSPGENSRVMPEAYPRISEEQLLQSNHRRRRLYAGSPLAELLSPTARTVLQLAMADLADPAERIEQGIGLFIDRPLGYGKATGEPDLTPLLAHEAFSPSLARRRGKDLVNLADMLKLAPTMAALQATVENEATPGGLPHQELADCPRPTVALTDVRKVADDFIIARTLPASLAQLLSHAGVSAKVRLAVNTRDHEGKPVLTLFDEALQRVLELHADISEGYRTRAGMEWPRAGIRVKPPT